MRSHKAIQQGRVHTLYDPDLLSQVGEWLFEPAELEQRGLIKRRSTGRRSAFTFTIGEQSFVLRHYWRGGLVGRWVEDRYLWTGLARSRPIREWDLLRALQAKGLPAPQPAAVRIHRVALAYRADLITQEIPKTATLADRLQGERLGPHLWRRVGETIRQFHDCGAYHADLNARNILIDSSNRIFVIDWDRGAFRRQGRWKIRNMHRLLRSLEKLKSSAEPFHYSEEEKKELFSGYNSANA